MSSTERVSCDTTDAIQVAIGVVVAVPMLIGFVLLKEAQKRIPDSTILRVLVGPAWVSE